MNQRERRLGIATGVFVGATALWLVGIEPVLGSWRELGDREDVLLQALERERALAARRPDLEGERAALEAALRPPEGEGVVPWFVAFVRDLTREAGFQPTSLRYVRGEVLLEDGEETPFGQLRFELRARVELPQLQGFLVRLAGSPRPVRVVSVAVTPDDDGKTLDVDLSLVALAPREALEQERRP